LTEGMTLAQAAEETGVSTATCQKIKKGDYDQS
jgi:DNA-binding XRE family transcriptional regulator